MERDFSVSDPKPYADNFNSHAHVERDRLGMHSTVLIGNFNSHAHVERDCPPASRLIPITDFNSHAHVERDT